MMMTGFLLALLAQRFMFRDAELKSEVVTGLILLLAALLINMTQHTLAATFISSTFVGMATGIVGTRFLLFFIKAQQTLPAGNLAKHVYVVMGDRTLLWCRTDLYVGRLAAQPHQYRGSGTDRHRTADV